MGAHRHKLRDYLVTRIAEGDFASVKEIMLVGDLPRQTVNRWLREAKITLAECRLARIADERAQALQYLERMDGRRLSADDVRRETVAAVRRFNEALAKDVGRARTEGDGPPSTE